MPSKVDELSVDEPPTTIEPYRVLGLNKEATQDEVKSAYRKAALKHHPDKAQPEDKESAHKKFQEIAFAYAILSDERRRKRYDTTGRTEETLSVNDDNFDWSSFYHEQYRDAVNFDSLEKFAREYKAGDEQKRALLKAYEKSKGNMNKIYEVVMCSNPLEDEERFRAIIDSEIEAGNIIAYSKYTKETEASRKRRMARARKEEQEAAELAEELGLNEKLSAARKDTARSRKSGAAEAADEEGALADLQASIQQRQKERAGKSDDFFDGLVAKYGGGQTGTKRGLDDEPSEEAFERSAKRTKQTRSKTKTKAK